MWPPRCNGALRVAAVALVLLPLAGCAHFHHRGRHTGHCADPDMPADVPNLPALKVEPGMTAPDTRNAVVIPPVGAAGARKGDAPSCLSRPPSYKG